MKQIARETAIVIPVVAVLCLVVLLVAQGRLFPDFVAHGQQAKAVSEGCFYMSLPGVTAAVAIWVYSSERTIWSDLVAVSVNAILYSTLIILLLSGLRRWRLHHKSA